MTPKIRPGDRLRITILCEADELKHGDQLFVSLPQPNGVTKFVGEIPLHTEGINVEVLTPEKWPPIEGDIWEDGQDVEWYAVRRHGNREVTLVNTGGNFAVEDLDDMLSIRGPWHLVREGRERKFQEPPF
ncbi:hypothetical protein SAMN05421874_12881 [Nonomuraea maritima]|uniref:Uncharacterized protein n=1 Tax=Nonomuraea maritima TaxID=683260 RepID=A0A1G9MLE5_9ACTN|nr:hypothetical protein [Nonomuraea maritima]SDL74841.1 hypothetical protein SAMN05421874_12881 [Nonomuraea maritima]